MKASGLNGWKGSNLINPAYFKQLKERRWRKHQQDLAVFGIAGGGLLALFSGFRLFYINDNLEILWTILGVLGLALAVVGLIFPPALDRVLQVYRRAANGLGNILFKLLLAWVYALVITPVGWLIRHTSGSAPFYSWVGEAPQEIEGWTDKQVDDHTLSVAKEGKKRGTLLMPVDVFAAFIRYRRFVMLPVLVVLIALGVLMFFVSTSSLAPLIYTLF